LTIEILRPETREEWLRLRQEDVTASAAAAVLGAHAYTTQYQLWALKTGRTSEDPEETPILRRGRLFEPVNAQMLIEDYPDWRVEYPLKSAYYRDAEKRIGATPDCFARRPDKPGFGVVQFKSVSDLVFKEKWLAAETGAVVVPLWIACQAIVEAAQTGASWACVSVVVVGFGIELHVIDIPLHEGVMRSIEAGVETFWRVVNEGGHPPIDWQRDGGTVLDVFRQSEAQVIDLSSDAELDDLLTARARGSALVEEGKRILKAVNPQIIYRMGNHERAKTAHHLVSAPTSVRRAHVVDESIVRVLKIKPVENLHV
jgi:hypothetical protein